MENNSALYKTMNIYQLIFLLGVMAFVCYWISFSIFISYEHYNKLSYVLPAFSFYFLVLSPFLFILESYFFTFVKLQDNHLEIKRGTRFHSFSIHNIHEIKDCYEEIIFLDKHGDVLGSIKRIFFSSSFAYIECKERIKTLHNTSYKK